MNFRDMSVQSLDSIAEDVKYLATNFTDVVPSCCDPEVSPASELMNRHPVLNWLLNTRLTARIKNEMNTRGFQCMVTEDEGVYSLKVPGIFWSTIPDIDEEACCFPTIDFAKCAGTVPLTRLCVKDCDSIDHELLGRFMRIDSSYGGIVNQGSDYNEVRERIAKLSMAFYMARNMMLGVVGSTSAGLKSFHGLFNVMSNPAVIAIPGANTLAAFEILACRLRIFEGDLRDYVIAMNPVIYASLLNLIVPNQYGALPLNWTRNGDVISYYGATLMADPDVPFNMATNTGEIWFMKSEVVGGWMATDLIPSDDFIKRGPYTEETVANGCGSECVYYYNYGAVFNNDSSKLARIVNVPVSAYCASAIGDLGNLINPQTLIPKA